MKTGAYDREETVKKLHKRMWKWWIKMFYEYEEISSPGKEVSRPDLETDPLVGRALGAIADQFFLLNRWGQLSFTVFFPNLFIV